MKLHYYLIIINKKSVCTVYDNQSEYMLNKKYQENKEKKKLCSNIQ